VTCRISAVLPDLWPGLRSSGWRRAGAGDWHRALNRACLDGALKLLPSLSPFAG